MVTLRYKNLKFNLFFLNRAIYSLRPHYVKKNEKINIKVTVKYKNFPPIFFMSAKQICRGGMEWANVSSKLLRFSCDHSFNSALRFPFVVYLFLSRLLHLQTAFQIRTIYFGIFVILIQLRF